MIEYMDEIEVVRNLAQIFEKIHPTTSISFYLNTIQGGISNSPSTTMASIPTYMNPKMTTKF
jgi:transcription elongation factor GreA-like protein